MCCDSEPRWDCIGFFASLSLVLCVSFYFLTDYKNISAGAGGVSLILCLLSCVGHFVRTQDAATTIPSTQLFSVVLDPPAPAPVSYQQEGLGSVVQSAQAA